MEEPAETTPLGKLRGQQSAMFDGGTEDSASEDLVANIFNRAGQVPRESSCPSLTKATKGVEDSADQADLADLEDVIGRKEQLPSEVSSELAEFWSDDDEESKYSGGSGSQAVEAMAAAGGGDEAEDGGGEDSVIKRRWREPP